MPPNPSELQITLNGEPRTVPAGGSIADLLVSLHVARETVAVERNRDVVRRSDHATTPVQDGDVIELVQFVGGGL